MRILYVSNFDPELNAGASGSILGITTTLSGQGHDVDVVWRDKKPDLIKNQALHELLELPWRQYAQVKLALKKKAYDLVSISQPFSYLIYEKLLPRYSQTIFLNRTHGWEDRVYAVRKRWESDPKVLNSPFSKMRRLLTHNACVRTIKACHGIVAPGSRCADFIMKNYPISPEKIAIVPHGLYPPFFEQNLPERDEKGPARLLYIGNYLPLKGSKVMEAILPSNASKFPDTHMTFVVDAAHVERVKNFFGPFFKNRLTVISWTERENLVSIYGSHHIFLFPSLFEGFGKTFLEAMACGMCVVGFEEGGLSDLAASGKEALFCAPGDLQSLQSLLEDALKHPDKRKQIGQAAQSLVRQYTWERSANHLQKFVERLRIRYGMKS